MITGGGKGAAYIPAKPTDIKGLNPLDIYDRLENKRRYQLGREDAEKEAKQKKLDKFGNSLKLADGDFKTKVSGIKSVDDINRNAATLSLDKNLELTRQAQEAAEKGDMVTARKLRDRALRLRGSWKNSQGVITSLQGRIENFNKLVKEGKISDGDDLTAMVARSFGEKDFVVELDDNDNWVYKIAAKDPETGDTYYQEFGVEDLDRQLKGKPKTNIDQLASTIAKDAGYKTTKDSNGRYFTEIKEPTQSLLANIDTTIASLSNSGEEEFFDLFFQATGKRKYSKFTEEDRTEVKNYLEDKLKGGLDYSNKKSADSTYLKGAELAEKRKSRKQKDTKYTLNAVETAKGDLEGSTVASASDLDNQKYTLKSQKGSGNPNNIKGIHTNSKLELVEFNIIENKVTGDIQITGGFSEPTEKYKGSTGGAPSMTLKDHVFTNTEITNLINYIRNTEGEESQTLLSKLEQAKKRVTDRKKEGNIKDSSLGKIENNLIKAKSR